MGFLVSGEETSCFDRVGEDEEAAGADEDSQKTFDDEDPTPAFETTGLADRVEATGQQTSEGPRERCRSVKDANAKRKLSTLVEVREVENLSIVRTSDARILGALPCRGEAHPRLHPVTRAQQQMTQSSAQTPGT